MRLRKDWSFIDKKKYRPPYSPERLRECIDKYFAECEAEEVFPDYPGMKLRLKINEDDIRAMCDESFERAGEYINIFNAARDRRRSWLERKMLSDKTSATGCLNALRQPENGGYVEKNNANNEKVLNIKVHGLKNGMEAFK